jgi:hypothetical protein
MMIEVWHTVPRVPGSNVRCLLDSDDHTRAARIVCGDDQELIYQLVAFVSYEPKPSHVWTREDNELGLDHAYAMTQNISQSWAKNTGVRCRLEQCRSTSIGDVLVFEGQRWIVDSFGFSKLIF